MTAAMRNRNIIFSAMKTSETKMYSAFPVLAIALVLQLVQIGLFATPYSTLRLSFAGINLLLLAFAVARQIGQRHYHAGVSALYTLSIVLSWVLSKLMFNAEIDWGIMGIQLAFPIYLGAVGGQPSRMLLSLIAYAGAGVVAYAAVYAALSPQLLIDGKPRLQGFVELRAPHNSSYLIASIAIFFWIVGVRQRQLASWFYMPVLALAAILVIFYQVRTAQVMLIAFFALLAAPYLRGKIGTALIVVMFTTLAAAIVVYVGSETSRDLETFSSGRTSVYLERIELIAAREFAVNFLGSGAGTDLLYSDVWWWDAKNSHNDFLTTLIERGVIGLFLLLWYLVAMCRYRRWESIVIILAIITTGLLSNGLFQRPLPLLFAAFALWASQSYRRA